MQEKKMTKNLKVKKVSVVGVIPSFAFQRAKHCALELHKRLPQRFPQPEIVGLLELDWNEKLMEWRQTLGREYWCLRRPVAVFFDGKFVGSDIELIKLTAKGNILLENVPRKNMSFMKEHFRKDYISYLKKTKRIYCYLDICIDGIYAGTLTFQLYSDLLPRTCENFKTLCLGSRGPLLSYRGSRIHRIVKKGWLQGGDIQYKTGGGGYGIFCDPLEDECFGISHDRRGILSMAGSGRHSNGSQFLITLVSSKWMDTRFVAFGRLVEGSHVLKLIEDVESFYECPLKLIEIKSCGKLDLEDVEDVDARYREEPFPKRKPKVIEKVSDQMIRLIMEALTDALKRRERAPDILDDGDVPSKMNLQLYFQGFYSIPQEILEESARYLRNLRRELFRVVKPSATEVVEVLMYDLLMAVLTKMTTLDDIKETVGHELYRKMIGGIDMELELCQKPHVKRLVDQIVSTARSMIALVSKKIAKMKIMSGEARFFQEKMQRWVQSFVLQETFSGDNYHISDRPSWNVPEEKPPQREERERPKREGKPCCDLEKKQKKDLDRLKGKYPPEDVCCMGSKLTEPEEVKLSDYFKACNYDFKRVPKFEKERMPLLDLIEISRFKLRWLRRRENAARSKERIALEKKVRKWMEEVVYTPETSWIKDLLFAKDELVYDHLEEILYGAMTAGLLEMYYFYERYLRLCGARKQKLVSRMVYPEDSDLSSDEPGPPPEEDEEEEEAPAEEKAFEPEKKKKPPCTCGHPCCVCEYDPNAPTPPPSLEEEEFVPEESPAPTVVEPPEVAEEVNPCGSDMELVDLNALLAEKAAMKPEEVDIRSFKWLRPYILEKGCDLKSEFASQAHKWLDGERFSCKGFISKHSMVTKASLLSLSMSLAELLAEGNQMKTEIKNFVYDLWDLYFGEMFKEAALENPPEETGEEKDGKIVEEAEEEEISEREPEYSDECKKIMAETPEFDFGKFCERFGSGQRRERDEEKEEENKSDEDPAGRKNVKMEEVSLTEIAVVEAVSNAEIGGAQEAPNVAAVAPVAKVEEGSSSADEDEEEPAADSEAAQKGEDLLKSEEGEMAKKPKEKPKKKKKSPFEVQELVEESSGDEDRQMPPYVLPFWVRFLTELTKQALGSLAKISRLPRRLYFQPDSDLDFDDKMKEWFEFNAFNPQPTKGREIKEFIALHRKSLTSLEDTARSYLKKKKYSELLNRCTRIASSEAVADEIVADVIGAAMKDRPEAETLELYVSNLVSSAIAGSRRPSGASFDGEEEEENSFETYGNESYESEEAD